MERAHFGKDTATLGCAFPSTEKGRKRKSIEFSSRNTCQLSSQHDSRTCSHMPPLGKLERGAPRLGVQWWLRWWAQSGSTRLGPEPLWALPWGIRELLQSCEGRERSEGAPTFLLHHRREAKPTRLVAKHPWGPSSPGSDVLSSILAVLPPFPLRARILAALPFAPSRPSDGAEHARLPGQTRSRGRFAKRLMQPASGKPGASAGARQVGKRTHTHTHTHGAMS